MKNKNKIRIAVTGHRYLDHLQVIEESIEFVILTIMARHPNSNFVLYSPLAPGADHVAAACALSIIDARLVVILPMQIEKYLDMFTEKQKNEFWQIYDKRADQVILPVQSGHDMSFLNLGKYLVKYSDYLIAVWNGQKERGTGGTAQVVEMAKDHGLKIAWVRANNLVGRKSHPIINDLQPGSIELINW